MEDGKKFRGFMAGMGELFNKKTSETINNFYWEALRPFSDAECEKAFNLAIASCTFFPRPAELIEFIIGNSKEKSIIESQKQQAIATMEADRIISHLKIFGGSKYPEMTNPITKHLMTHRWPYKTWATQVLESELVWWKKEFVTSYNSFVTSEKMLENPKGKLKEIIGGVGKNF